MSHLSWRQAAILATLLEADGAVVSYVRLGDVTGTLEVNVNAAIGLYAHRIRARGIDCIETVVGRGLRMKCLPPDWALEDILAVLDTLRRQDRRARTTLVEAA